MTASNRSRSDAFGSDDETDASPAPDAADARDEFSVVRVAALRLLARREHSTDELHRKLIRRGYSEETIVEVVASLRDSSSVSNERFAESFVRVRAERGQGPLRIRAELRERGIEDRLVDELLTTAADDWLARAQKARVKRFGIAPPASRDAWNQQARFLAHRGYPAELIYRTLGALRS